jgi:hypothetical protein
MSDLGRLAVELDEVPPPPPRSVLGPQPSRSRTRLMIRRRTSRTQVWGMSSNSGVSVSATWPTASTTVRHSRSTARRGTPMSAPAALRIAPTSGRPQLRRRPARRRPVSAVDHWTTDARCGVPGRGAGANGPRSDREPTDRQEPRARLAHLDDPVAAFEPVAVARQAVRHRAAEVSQPRDLGDRVEGERPRDRGRRRLPGRGHDLTLGRSARRGWRSSTSSAIPSISFAVSASLGADLRTPSRRHAAAAG